MKTLVIVSHPYPEQSTAIMALQQVAKQQDDVVVRNLESLYGNDMSRFDVAAEQWASEQADRIVFLFPIHWFNLTPMLKAYLNTVWSYGWAFGSAWKLKDKEMQVVVTAGATAFTYSADGIIKSTMDEVLTPMKASAYYIGMTYNRPLVFFEAMGKSQSELGEFQRAFIDCLHSPLASRQTHASTSIYSAS
ncbi:NAD(P)H-dependent oxidoreductase [Dickeya zeae]|uniref:NAD(P)H-dependent oxidoreductase n=1 Tax=Dickeya oryzae TaxID=1240404 RepID=A0AB39IE22_9GAMM|nr:NAD(P)H-dependent oxidoreductase [Dickeya oryzae]MCA6996184.1 NAD(P)H-dependent oxidoreductase [Dickeya oryzae]UUE09269.1 NAD(P)H-dependent oxidoreductase [Dickeya zeae]